MTTTINPLLMDDKTEYWMDTNTLFVIGFYADNS